MAKSKRNISRKRKQSRKLTQKGTKRNRKLKRGKLVGGYNKELFLKKFEALGLPNLGADVNSEISRIIENSNSNSNSIKDFLIKKNQTAKCGALEYRDVTEYEKYCIEKSCNYKYPNEFTFKPPGPVSSFFSFAPGSIKPGGQDKEAFTEYKRELSGSIEKFKTDFAGKESAILKLFEVLDEEAREATDKFRDNETGILPVNNEANRQKLIATFNNNKTDEEKNNDEQTKEDGI
jgi:hypothetical protein